MLKHYRGTIHEAAKVTDIFPGDTVTIFTTKGNYSCKNLVITAGPWTTDLVKPLGLNLPLKVTIYFVSSPVVQLQNIKAQYTDISLSSSMVELVSGALINVDAPGCGTSMV